jgi:hypothetical protein
VAERTGRLSIVSHKLVHLRRRPQRSAANPATTSRLVWQRDDVIIAQIVDAPKRHVPASLDRSFIILFEQNSANRGGRSPLHRGKWRRRLYGVGFRHRAAGSSCCCAAWCDAGRGLASSLSLGRRWPMKLGCWCQSVERDCCTLHPCISNL